jgi:hypothetical protein
MIQRQKDCERAKQGGSKTGWMHKASMKSF